MNNGHLSRQTVLEFFRSLHRREIGTFKGGSIMGSLGLFAELVATQHPVLMYVLTHNHTTDILSVVKSNFLSYVSYQQGLISPVGADFSRELLS